MGKVSLMPLPSGGWLPAGLNTGTEPEQWLLPEPFVGSYYDPSAVAFEDSVLSPVLVTVGDGAVAGSSGWDVGGNPTIQLSLSQLGVFSVVLLDSVDIPSLIPRCFPVTDTNVPEPATVSLDCQNAPGDTSASEGDPAAISVDEESAVTVSCVAVEPDQRIVDDDECVSDGSLISYV
jgi:hypothetical protein